MMPIPKMILFDYGHTLLCEQGFNKTRGTQALLNYAVSNPNKLMAKDVCAFSDQLYEKFCKTSRDRGIEIHNHHFQRLLYDCLQIEFKISASEMEQIFWDYAAPGEPMEDIDKVLDYLNENHIRSGVISNISFGSDTLKKRIDRLLPNNRFEFVITTSEYMVRKPNPLIFQAALGKAKLSADETWYCGDHTICDVYGAYQAGLFPVWYHSLLECDYRDHSLDVKPVCEHLYINHWTQLITILKEQDHGALGFI